MRTSSGSSTVTRGGLGVSKSSTGSSVGGSSSGGSKSGSGSVGRQQERRQLSGWSAGRAPRARAGTSTVTEQGLVYDAPGRGQGGVERPYWDESVHYVFAMDEILAAGGGRRAAALDVPRGRRPRRHSPSGSATSRCPSGAGRPSRRPGGATTRTSTAASTCATTAAARASCWSTTPTPRPRCSRRRSCSGTGCKDVHPGDDQWNSLHEKLVERWATIARRAAVERGALHLVVGRRHRRGPRDRRLPAGDRGRGRASTPSVCRSRTSAGTPRSTASSTWRRPR